MPFYFPELPFCFPDVLFCFLELPLCFVEISFCFPKVLFNFSKMPYCFTELSLVLVLQKQTLFIHCAGHFARILFFPAELLRDNIYLAILLFPLGTLY